MSAPDPVPPPPQPGYSGVRRFFAGLMIAAGALLLLVSGGCTLTVALGDLDWALPALLFGAFGIVPGIALILIGRML